MGQAKDRARAWGAGAEVPMVFYATPDATTALDDLGACWGMPPERTLLRLANDGLDIVEALQMARQWAIPPMPRGYVLPDPSARFLHFDREAKAGGVSALPEGARAFHYFLPVWLYQRMHMAAVRENAWRMAGKDYANRPPTVNIQQSIVGWALYEGLVRAPHRLFPATKAHQLRTVAVESLDG